MNKWIADEIKIPPLKREWVRCPHCGAKVVVYDNTATCRGVYLKCTRACKKTFELVIENGKQIERA